MPAGATAVTTLLDPQVPIDVAAYDVLHDYSRLGFAVRPSDNDALRRVASILRDIDVRYNDRVATTFTENQPSKWRLREPFPPEVRAVFRRLRRDRNLTQEELGKRCKPLVSRDAISDLETGNRASYPTTVTRVLAALESSMENVLAQTKTTSVLSPPGSVC